MSTLLENSRKNFVTFRRLLGEQLSEGLKPEKAFTATAKKFSEASPSGFPTYMAGRKQPYKTSTLRAWARGAFTEGHDRKLLGEPLLPLNGKGRRLLTGGTLAPSLDRRLARIEEKLDQLLADKEEHHN